MDVTVTPITEDLTNNEIINRILLELNKRKAGHKLTYFLAQLPKERKIIIVDLMLGRDLMSPLEQQSTVGDPTYKISDKASSILAENDNNYLLFLDQAKIKQKKIDDKLELDLVSAKRQVKWFYPLLIISFIGLLGTITGIWNIFRIKSVEKKTETLTNNIYLLFQQQKADSVSVLQNDIQKK